MKRRARPRGPRKAHSDSRTIPLRGTGDDAGKWYKCWNCGFRCKVGRDALGGPADRDGITLQEVDPSGSGSGADRVTYANVNKHTLMQIDAAGDYTTPPLDRQTFIPVVNRGCPFCGSMNWRGDYP